MENTRKGVSNSNPKPYRKVNHVFAFRNNLGSSCESRKIMTNIAVVLLNADCMFFPDNMSFGRQNFCESVPIISKKEAISTMFNFVVKSLECRCIAVAKNPCYCSPRIAVNSFYEPEFVFLNR